MDNSFKSRSFVLICLFMINQCVLCLENNSPVSLPASESRFIAEKPSSSNFLNGDAFRNSGLLSYLKNLYQLSRENDELENQLLDRNDLQNLLINNNDYYRKRTANKGWNKLHGLIGKRNEQLNDDSMGFSGTSSELANNGLMRNFRASNKWNQLNSVWGKRDDPFKKQHQKGWNNLGDVWG